MLIVFETYGKWNGHTNSTTTTQKLIIQGWKPNMVTKKCKLKTTDTYWDTPHTKKSSHIEWNSDYFPSNITVFTTLHAPSPCETVI